MAASNRVIVTKGSSILRMVVLLASEIEGIWEPKLSLSRKGCQEKGASERRPAGTARCDYAERFFSLNLVGLPRVASQESAHTRWGHRPPREPWPACSSTSFFVALSPNPSLVSPPGSELRHGLVVVASHLRN